MELTVQIENASPANEWVGTATFRLVGAPPSFSGYRLFYCAGGILDPDGSRCNGEDARNSYVQSYPVPKEGPLELGFVVGQFQAVALDDGPSGLRLSNVVKFRIEDECDWSLLQPSFLPQSGTWPFPTIGAPIPCAGANIPLSGPMKLGSSDGGTLDTTGLASMSHAVLDPPFQHVGPMMVFHVGALDSAGPWRFPASISYRAGRSLSQNWNEIRLKYGLIVATRGQLSVSVTRKANG